MSNEYENENLPVPAETEGEKPEEESILPYALAGYRLKLYAVAAVFAVAGVAIAIYLKSPAPLLLTAFSAYFAWRAVNVARRYRSGMIREVAVLCTGVNPSRLRDSMSVTFRTAADEENPTLEYFKFSNQPKRTAEEFVVNAPYVIYFDIENPQTLLGYINV